MNKLTIEHLAPYLPYGLKVFYTDNNTIYKMVISNNTLSLRGGVNIDDILETKSKPIVRPLRDLSDVQIGELDLCHDFSMMKFSEIKINPLKYPYTIVLKLFEWHFDVFGLIEKGLALDINHANL